MVHGSSAYIERIVNPDNTDQLKYHRLVQTEISRVETYCKIYTKN